MLNIYYVDYDPSGSSNGITSYTAQYLSVMTKQKAINLTCIWLNSSVPSKRVETSLEGICHYYLPKYKSESNYEFSSNEWTANLIYNIVSGSTPIIHINWITHCNIIKYLKWRIDCKIVLTKHCIPWRDLITNNYFKFKQIDGCFQNGMKWSTLDTTLVDEASSYKYVDHIIAVTNLAKRSLTSACFGDNGHAFRI